MKDWWSPKELAGLPGMPSTARNVRLSAERRGLQGRQDGNGWAFHIASLPAATQLALARLHGDTGPADITQATRELWRRHERATDEQKTEATRRTSLLDRVETLARHANMTEAFHLVAQSGSVPAATLKNWYYGTRARPGVNGFDRADWPAVLLPGHTGRTRTAQIPPEAWDLFKADYLRNEAPAAKACHERLTRIAGQRGWALPHEKTFLRKLRREVPDPVVLLARRGNDALKHAYPEQERDHAYFHALQAVNADGHKFDVFVRWPDGSIVRPLAVVWQDIYSGKILSWRIERHESSDGYRLAFGDLVERVGIPEHAYLDNGRGIAAKLLTGGAKNRYRWTIKDEDPVGIFTQLIGEQGIHWTTPYWGQAKPIERAFRDWCEYVAKHPAFSGAYTGNKPDAKPENYASRAVPLEDFLRILETEINAHNARTGRRSKVCDGRSFDDVFAESYSQSLIRKATPEQRRLWLLAAQGITADRGTGAVTLDKNRYWSEALAQHKGKKLILRFDPDRLHGTVYAYTSDGRYIGEAECIQAAGFGDQGTAREHARLRTQWVNNQKQQLARERRMSALEMARHLPDQPAPAAPAAHVIRPAFQDHLTRRETPPVDDAAVAAVAETDTGLEHGFNEHVAALWEQKKSQLL